MDETKQKWSPNSWTDYPAEQQPEYQDTEAVSSVLEKIRQFPPLVFAGEVDSLKTQLADAAAGKAFLLQGGDCAETFNDCNEASITRKLKILLQMSVVLAYGTKRPIVRVGRIAGQYAKPRTKLVEVVNGVSMNAYRGDNINCFEPDVLKRKPDPEKLIDGYHFSSMTLNYVRALMKGGFADLHHPENWDLEFLHQSPQKQRYKEIVGQIKEAIEFMESLGNYNKELESADFFTSHEGLILGFEEAMTRYVPELDQYYNLGAHMLWIGDRTKKLTGAHVEYFKGIANPVGIKIGASSDPREIVEISKALNPKNDAGKVVLITRFGTEAVDRHLSAFIDAVTSAKQEVLWSVDPMHGNGLLTETKVKTRDFNAIQSELHSTFAIHQQHETQLGGVHFELTGDNVTECIGGAEGITLADLDRNYETYCDPRLNNSQSLEMAFAIAALLQKKGI